MESDAFGKVVDIDIAVGAESLDVIENHPAWETWVSFDEMSITTTGDEDEDEDENLSPLAVSSAGRIRVKGQSTNTIPACLGLKNLPFNIEFDTPFLGMENFYLRNHLWDYSYMRDHSAHVMLKAYGLPYLRTRPARVFINGVYTGFYTLMEAPTQAYVLQVRFFFFSFSCLFVHHFFLLVPMPVLTFLYRSLTSYIIVVGISISAITWCLRSRKDGYFQGKD
jgi:hypothetical protein